MKILKPSARLERFLPIATVYREDKDISDELVEAFVSVLSTGHFILGEQVRAFEEEVAKFLGVKHAVSLNSGTDALVIALRAAGVGPGDEVVTTPFTFFATSEAISRVGARPVFVDIDPGTFNLDAERVEAVITERTKAILPVHLYGHPVDMDPIMELAERYGLKVIEDAAQAFGAKYKGRYVGTIGDVGCFSFFPTKNLGALGDGGLLVTDDDEIAEVARKLRNHGGRDKYSNEMLGYNSRLDEIQAAFLRVKLKYLEGWNERRREIAKEYTRQLLEVSDDLGVRVLPPVERNYAYHVYHQYTIRVESGKRDALFEWLRSSNVGAMVYYPKPLYALPVYEKEYGHLEGRMPNTERAAKEVISLPIGPFIREDEVKAVVEVIASFYREQGR